MMDNFEKLYYSFHWSPRVQYGSMYGTKFSYRIPYSSYYSIYQPRNIMIATPEELYGGYKQPEKKEEQEKSGNNGKESSSKSSGVSVSPVAVGLIGAALGGIIANATKQNILVGTLIGAGVFAGGAIMFKK